jgi:tRNA dimethylallyltransferase
VAEVATPSRLGPHLALVGPTASGKSELAFEVAIRRPETELVCVDSMSVYRHLDIGTAKPSREQRRRVPHHMLDLVEPEEEFTVRQFQDAARRAIAEIEGRGHRALLVAGTALYLRAVVDDLRLPGRWPELAKSLEREFDEPGGTETLYARLEALDPAAASRILPSNKRRLVRALEVTIGSGRPFSSFGPGLTTYPPTRFVISGIPFDPALHDSRVESRFRRMLEEGLADEVSALSRRPFGLSRTARQALGYKELLSHFEAGVRFEDAVSEAIARTKAFARRQWRWFRRDPRTVWIEPTEDRLSWLLGIWDASSAPCAVGD